MAELDDLLVRVRRKGRSGIDAHTYTIEMQLEGGRLISEQDQLIVDDYAEPLLSDNHALAAHGVELFNRLFPGKLAVAFHQAWTAAGARQRVLRVRLSLDTEAPKLHAIPWELLHFDDSGGMAAPRPFAADARLAFSRYIESADFNEGEPIARRPVRMLIAISTPNDLERWNLTPVNRAAEERDFRTRFGAVAGTGQFTYDILPTVTEDSLQNAIARGSIESEQSNGYDVLLYMGHALHNQRLGSRLVIEDSQTGRVALYDADEFVTFIQKLPATHQPAMIVLVACNSATAVGDKHMNSLAARLVAESGIPAVLAMQRLVEISLARSFTFHLSEQLLRDGVIDVAVNAARRRVFQPDSVGWSTPVLYMRSRTGRLFSPNARLEYVSYILGNPEFMRWIGPEYIDVGVQAVAPGQDWNLLRMRPEDAPAPMSALETIQRSLASTQPDGERRRASDAIQPRTNLIAVIGPPHSGQTTILRRLSYELANATIEDLDRQLGLYISLSGFEQQRGAGRLERHIVEQARLAVPALCDALTELFRPKASNSARAQSPRYVFLLDDLDALPERSRIDVGRELAAIVRRMGDQQFVIASSQDAFPGTMFNSAYVLVIQPLSEHEILRYISRRDEENAFQIFGRIRENRLLALAGDPTLLGLIYERTVGDPQARITRNQLVQESLDRALAGVDSRFSIGDAARESITELAWYSRWSHRELLPLAEVFGILARVRRDRDYSLEELYSLLCSAGLLIGIGQHAVRFVNSVLQSYCAALALSVNSDLSDRLHDIITLCSNPERLAWWEDVIYSLAGLMSDTLPLFEALAAAIRDGSYTHTLVAARCLEALPPDHESRLPAELRAELLDACIVRLRSDREPSAERREQLAIALGRLSYLQVRHELRRLLVERVRPTSSGLRYEYTNVRIAAARALRNIYTSSLLPNRRSQPRQPSLDTLVFTDHSDQASLADRPVANPVQMPALQELREEQMVVRIIRTWERGADGRTDLRDLLRNSPNPPERALAAFALGDLGDRQSEKLYDARQLLRVILSPEDDPEREISEDWEDTMWAAADALTLFNPNQVIPLLTVLVKRKQPIPDKAAQQLAYLAGRLRANNEQVVEWLICLLVTNPSQIIKSRALQSLAWMGLDIPNVRLPLPDDRPGPTLKQLIQDIAAWRPIRTLKMGKFAVTPRKDDPEGNPIYLRLKAIDALAWIGDAETLKDLGSQFMAWPLNLREHWYLAAATIKRRLGKNGGRTS